MHTRNRMTLKKDVAGIINRHSIPTAAHNSAKPMTRFISLPHTHPSTSYYII